jgi:glycosyltransferase involved in cell wall biosynthesis
VIASDVGPYRDFITDGETGFLIRYEHEWLKRMSELASDSALRERMGAAARARAREHTIEGNWGLWEKAYADLF